MSPAPSARVHSKGAAVGVVEERSPQALTRLPPQAGLLACGAVGNGFLLFRYHPVCGARSRSSEGSGQDLPGELRACTPRGLVR